MSGQERWHRDTSTVGKHAVAGGLLHIRAFGAMVAFEAMTGQERWRFPLPGLRGSAPVVAGDTVYFEGESALYAVEAATGAERWRFTVGAPVQASPVVIGGVVYVGADDGLLHALGAVS